MCGHLRKHGIRVVIPVPADRRGQGLRRGGGAGRPRPPTGAATNREKQRRGITTRACPRMRARAAGGSRRPAAVRAVAIAAAGLDRLVHATPAAADGSACARVLTSHLFQIRTLASCDPSLQGEFSYPEPFGSV